METMTEVQVDELCTSTVNITPIIRPTIGFVSSALFWKTVPEKRGRKVAISYAAQSEALRRAHIIVRMQIASSPGFSPIR